MPKSIYDEEIALYRKKRKDTTFLRSNADWRREWKSKGPVKFAEDLLKIDPNTGGPLLLSDDQKQFLTDVGLLGVRLAIITAGRGSGKTFVLAIYIMWRIFTHENWGISTMGGSKEQSDKINAYMMGWIKQDDALYTYSLNMVSKDRIGTVSGGEVAFHSCSGTSVRGAHTHELIIDEQAAGEEAGGTRFIQAALWEVSTSPDIHIIKSSTAHYVHGDFLATWNNADKLNYKKYRWAIAKHISGELDPYKVYQDINPKNWVSNAPWIVDRNIEILRDGRSNDEWLVEALGGISITSGLAFNPADIDACICDRCLNDAGVCKPYEEGFCPIVQYILQLEGVAPTEIPVSTKLALRTFVKERIEGIDWGKVSPCVYTAVGRYRNQVFVLSAKEILGMTDDDKVLTGIKTATKWQCDIIRPDPREWSYNNEIAENGEFSVHQLFTGEGGDKAKNTYLFTLKKYIERHKILIPVAFEDLIRSLKNLAYDKTGKIRKVDDHSFDSLLYAVSYYGELANQSEFWKAMRKSQPAPELGVEGLEKVPEEDDEEEDENSNVYIEDDIDVFNQMPKRKRAVKKKDETDETEVWQGVDLWNSNSRR